MDFLNKAIAQLSELFRSMTPGARITAGLLLAVVVISVAVIVAAAGLLVLAVRHAARQRQEMLT